MNFFSEKFWKEFIFAIENELKIDNIMQLIIF